MLWKKVFRDLKNNKGAYLSCLVIIVIGLMTFTSFSLVIQNLKLSQETFYQQHNFAEGFAKVTAMPLAQVAKLKDLEGIEKIQGRLVKDVRVLFSDKKENVYLRLVSVNPEDDHSLNGVELSQGISLNNKEMNIWLDNKFFEANNLQLNEKIEIVVEGKKRALMVVGLGKSPEFIYALRTSADLFPDSKSFGIAYVPYEIMKTLFTSHDNTVNDLIFTLEPETDYQSVEDRLKTELDPYGLESIFPRKDQISHLLLSEELNGLEAAAKGVPVLFLSIAGVILYIMLKRMIEQQRGQIGVLMSFGYTFWEIILHYLSYAVIVGFVGGIAGALFGMALSYPLTSMYQIFFNMPGLQGRFSLYFLVLGIILAVSFSLCAGYLGCKRILNLSPAEAVRPPAPPIGKRVWLEEITFLWGALTVQGKMAVRNISRDKSRSIFVFLGIMITFAIISLTWSMNDLIQKMLFERYEKIETYDLKVSFSAPQSEKKVLRELSGFPGVNKIEAIAEVPVSLHNKWHKKEVVLVGLQEGGDLYHILDKNDYQITPPQDGLLLSERLAELLDADVGTILNIESALLKGFKQGKELEVVGVVPQYLGVNAYMEINALRKFLGQKELATSVILNSDEASIRNLEEVYRQSPVISSIEDQGQMLKQSRELMASYSSMIYLYVLIGIIIGFTIIYNSSVISLSERNHELASMRVLGMTSSEVLSVITFEQWFIGFFAMICGFPAAKLLLIGMSNSLSNDVYTMPSNVTCSSYMMALIITSASIWVGQKAAGRKIDKLSLVGSLKIKE